MLNNLRYRAQSIGVKVIFGIIILVFVFWGVGNIGNSPAGSLAMVNGERISLSEFNKIFRRVYERVREQNPEIASNAELFNNLKRQVLDQVIVNTLMRQEAERLGILVTPFELRGVIGDMAVFQDQSGKFDPERYKTLLAAQKISPGEFEADLRHELLGVKLQNYVGMSAGAGEAEARAQYFFSLEKRIAEYVLFNPDDYTDKAEVSDSEISDYYGEHKELYRIPASANVEYIELTPDKLAAGYAVSDAEARDYYDKNIDEFKNPESRLARHIFIQAPADGSSEEGAADKIAKAKAEIEEIAAKLKAGEKFDTLAGALSQDKPSAENGGLLGWLERGQSGSKEFDDAAFALKPGSVSEPVRSAFGFHIIKVDEKKEASTETFAEAKEAIVKELSRKKADDDFTRVQKEAEDGLGLNQPFAELAGKFKVEVQSTGLVPELEVEKDLNLASDAVQVLKNVIGSVAAAKPETPAQDNAAATSSPRGQSGATVPVPLNVKNGVALVRVLEAAPSRIPELEAVKDRIKDELKAGKSRALARAAADAALPSFTGKDVPEAFKDKVKLSSPAVRVFAIIEPLGNSEQLVDALFSSSGSWLPSVYDTEKGSVIARTEKIEPVTEEQWEKVKGIFMAQLVQAKQEEARRAFMYNLFASAKVERSDELIDSLSVQ